MKKLMLFLLIAVCLIGSVFAQDRGARQERGSRQESNRRPNENSRQRETNPITVNGALKLEKGFVAVESGDSVFIVPMLNRYIGFISELKEGARVSVEGFQRQGGQSRNIIHPVKLTIDGKSYDFPALGQDPGFRNRSHNQPGYSRRSEGSSCNHRWDNSKQGRGRGNSGPKHSGQHRSNNRNKQSKHCCCR